LIAPADRVIVIGKSGHRDGVNHSRCSLTQQLSGPVTDTKRWAPVQFVIGEASDVVEEEGGVVEDPTGEAPVGEEEPHPETSTARTSVEMTPYITDGSFTIELYSVTFVLYEFFTGAFVFRQPPHVSRIPRDSPNISSVQ
jgi:hypothetical protein